MSSYVSSQILVVRCACQLLLRNSWPFGKRRSLCVNIRMYCTGTAQQTKNTKKQLSLKSSFRAAIAIADCRHIVYVVIFIGPSFFVFRMYLTPRRFRFRTSSFSALMSFSLSQPCSPLLQPRDREHESSLSPPLCRRCRHQPRRIPRSHLRHTGAVPTSLRLASD